MVSKIVESTNIKGKIASKILETLGNDFTYPAYNQSNEQLVEKKASADEIVESLDAEETLNSLIRSVLELGHAEKWNFSKVNETFVEKTINSLLADEKAAKKIMFQLVHLFNYGLQDIIASNKETIESYGESQAAETLDKLLNLAVATDNIIREAENRSASGLEYIEKLRESMRNLLVIKQATEIELEEAEHYLNILTKKEYVEIGKKFFSFVENVIKKTDFKEKIADMIVNKLGKDFTYPAYDESTGEVKEKHVAPIDILENLDNKNATELLARLVFELGNSQAWDFSKIDEAFIKRVINQLLSTEKTAEKIMLQIVHLFNYELEGVLENNKDLINADEEHDVVPPIIGELTKSSVAIDNIIREAENRSASGLDYIEKLRESMRNLLVIKQATEIGPGNVEKYIGILTNRKKEFEKIFGAHKEDSELKKGLKDANRDKDLSMFG